MYILYLDESGTHSDAKCFVLAGLAVFEREAHWYSEDVDAIQQRYFPSSAEPIPFHTTTIHAGAVPYNVLATDERRKLLQDIYRVIGGRRGVLFGAVIERDKIQDTDEAYDNAFEQLTSRFDLYVKRCNAKDESEQRGIMVVASSAYQERLALLGRRFRGGATRWGQVRTLADAPFFVPAANSRLLQLADFCANAIYSRYHSSNTRNFDIIASKFDRDEGKIHGLVHFTSNHECQCPACLSRQMRSRQP